MSVAETVRPSVRGAEGTQVVGLLVASGALTGGGAGFAAGALWAATGLDPLGAGAAAVAAGVAVALDAAGRLVGRPRPLAVGRQVPQTWGRLFGARTVAVLYGARLGVGPLTILTSWTWWAALLVGASLGPATGAAVGAAFAVARVVTMAVATGRPPAGGAMSRRMASVRRAEPAVAWTTIAVVLALGLAAAGCAGDDDGNGDAGGAGGRTEQDGGEPGRVELEPSTTTTTTEEDAALAELLLDDALPGFRRADDVLGAGPLDLEAAARAESDVAAERALLETRGFVRGTSRAWLGPGDDVAYVAIYEFRDAEGAAAYTIDGVETLEARGAAPFDVPAVEGARGFTTVDEAGGQRFTAHAVVVPRGSRWALVLVGSSEARRTPDEARDLAARQAERLAAG